jgi:hypothetical protein
MPNWCNNTLNIRHEDPAMIERAREAFNKGALLQEFIPCPQDLTDTVSGSMGEDQRAAHEAQQAANVEKYGYANWYDFQVAQWGTKWDVGADGQSALDQDGGGLVMNFDSAWAPPIAAYEKLLDMGFEILAYYYEPGMAFCGKWEDGCDDYYEYGGMTSEQIAEELPDDLDETFGISEQVAEWEAEDEENIEIDLNDGIDNINE